MSIVFIQSPFYTPGRGGHGIDSIVVHWMDGTLAATDAEFDHGSRRVSAHYGLEDGVRHQYVADGDTSWGAGDWPENQRCINIEHSADPDRPASAATIADSVNLMTDLCRKYGISPDAIWPHKKFFPTTCPGTLPLAAMIASVKAQLGYPTNPPPSSTPPTSPPTSHPAPQGGLNVSIIDLSHVTANASSWVRTRGVAPLQRLLVITADGLGGPGTRAALYAYQSRHALSPDAVFGPITATSLLAG